MKYSKKRKSSQKLFTTKSSLMVEKKISILSLLLILLVLPVIILLGQQQQHAKLFAAEQYVFGTLDTDSTKAVQENAAGVNTAMLEIGWNVFEPQDGVFSSTYESQLQQQLQAFQAAGQKVVLMISLHYTPSWVFSYPDSKFVDQNGITSSEANLVFNQQLRFKAETFINQVNQTLGLNNFVAIRISGGGDGEALYPPANSAQFWAYDANAQSTSSTSNRPSTIPQNPFPGWKPGQTTYNGQPFTTTQVAQWYTWYQQALTNEVSWQIKTFEHLGYTGQFYVLTPGQGARYDQYTQDINNYLNGSGDPYGMMGRGAAWFKFYQYITQDPNNHNLVAYISSVADGSGNNDLCQQTDSLVNLTDPQIDNWSAAREISYYANLYNLPKMAENPDDYPNADYNLTMMQTTARQMQSCGMLGMFWAHDNHLYDNTDSLSLPAYASMISQYNPVTSTTPTLTNTPMPNISSTPTPILTTSTPTPASFSPTPVKKKCNPKSSHC